MNRPWYMTGDILEIYEMREKYRLQGKYRIADRLRERAWILLGATITDGNGWTYPGCVPSMGFTEAWFKLTTRVPHPSETPAELKRKIFSISCKRCKHSYMEFCIRGLRGWKGRLPRYRHYPVWYKQGE